MTPVGDEDDLRKFWKKIRALYVPEVNDSQSLEWKFWKSGNMKHPSPASTYAKSFIKLPLDGADAGSLKLTN